MGRATNSFVSYVGHAEETIDEERVDLPEKSLWVAVLCRAALDAFKGPPQLDMSRKTNTSHKNLYNFNKDIDSTLYLSINKFLICICVLL